MSDKPDGGPAFPVFPPKDHATVAIGMTLRDYFAAKAMQAYLETYDRDIQNGGVGFDVVKRSYALADAMLKARQA